MPWAPDYVAVEGDDGLAAFCRADPAEPWLADYGTAASRAVDTFCRRQFGKLDAPTEVELDVDGAVQLDTGRWLVQTEDVHTTAGAALTIDGVTVAAGASGYLWWPRNAAAFGAVQTGITLDTRPTGTALLTGSYGWAAYPAAVVAAVRLQVNRWHVRRESPYGTAGSPSEGSEVRLTAVLDPDVRAILSGGRLVRKQLPR